MNCILLNIKWRFTNWNIFASSRNFIITAHRSGFVCSWLVDIYPNTCLLVPNSWILWPHILFLYSHRSEIQCWQSKLRVRGCYYMEFLEFLRFFGRGLFMNILSHLDFLLCGISWISEILWWSLSRLDLLPWNSYCTKIQLWYFSN